MFLEYRSDKVVIMGAVIFWAPVTMPDMSDNNQFTRALDRRILFVMLHVADIPVTGLYLGSELVYNKLCALFHKCYFLPGPGEPL